MSNSKRRIEKELDDVCGECGFDWSSVSPCEHCRAGYWQDHTELKSAAIAVVRMASIGDQKFISCLCLLGNNAIELRHALANLADVLRDEQRRSK